MDNTVIERVLQLSRSMAETRTLGALLDYAMDEAMSLVGAQRGFIVLLRDDGTLDFKVRRGTHRDGSIILENEISTSILDEVTSTGKPLIVSDAREDVKWGKAASVAVLGLRSVMCVPLISRGNTIGGLYVENRTIKNCFDQDDLAPLVLFANQAAVAIENAALNDELEARVASRTAELEQARAQIEQSWLEAVEANRLRTALLGNIAHDLRSPLAVVVSSLQLTLDGVFGDLTPEMSEWLGKSLNAVNLVLGLTNDVLDLTKIEMGGLAFYPEAANPNELLQRVYDVGMALPWAAKVEFELDIPTVLPTIVVDPKRLMQILVNLLSNALKFTNAGTVTMYATALEKDNSILFGVRDTGEGIPPTLIGELFQRFHQVDSDKRRRQLGTGLGLAICRELVELHGGRIWAESKVGVGSDFKFILPVKPLPR